MASTYGPKKGYVCFENHAPLRPSAFLNMDVLRGKNLASQKTWAEKKNWVIRKTELYATKIFDQKKKATESHVKDIFNQRNLDN